MPPRNRRAFAVLALIAATILPSELSAQWQEVPTSSAEKPAPRFDIAPTLAALAKTLDTANEDRTVASTAWTLLALVANGSTMRTGPHKDPIRVLIVWLKGQQEEAGHFSPRGVPCSRSEQFVATLAITEVLTASNYTLLKPIAVRGVDAVATAMRDPGASPANVEEFAWSMLLARSTALAKAGPDTGQTAASILSHARPAMVAGKVRRTDAILHLDDVLQGTKHPPELTVARSWPANLAADPLHTLVGAMAVARTDAKTRAAQFETLDQLVALRETQGEHAGAWAPAGGFDRVTTTAMHAITLALANGQAGLPLAK